MRRKRKHPQHQGMSPFAAGLIAIVLIAVGTLFAFTKFNPFASPYKLTAVFETANNLKPQLAGADRRRGRGQGQEGRGGRRAAGRARVKMEIKDKGLPIHEDAELKIRPRIFLEGNFFVDITPGSPSAPELEDGGEPIPMNQTVGAGAVRRRARRAPDRHPLGPPGLPQGVLEGPRGQGRPGLQRVAAHGESAFQNTAIVNQATLGLEPTRDLQRLLKGQQKTFAALVEDEDALKSLVTNFNIDRRRVRPRGRGAGGARSPRCATCCGSARPRWRRSTRRCPPCARSRSTRCRACAPRGPTLEASLPFIRQARALVGPRELRGAARQLRRQMPNLVHAQREPRCRSSSRRGCCPRAPTTCWCPFAKAPIPNPDEPGNNNQPFYRQAGARLRGPVRREPPLRRQPLLLPHQRRGARPRACARPRRPTAAPSRRRGVPTCPARPRSRRTSTRPAARCSPPTAARPPHGRRDLRQAAEVRRARSSSRPRAPRRKYDKTTGKKKQAAVRQGAQEALEAGGEGQ